MNDILELLAESIEENPDISLDSFITPELETELFLTAMEEMLTPDEFMEIVVEGATDLALYGIITDADVVTGRYEAAQEGSYNKRVVVKQTKDIVADRLEKRTCLRIEQKKDSPLWRKYKKGRTLMIEARAEIYEKNMGKARMIAKKAMQNSGRKASAMSSKRGATITDRMDAQIARMNNRPPIQKND